MNHILQKQGFKITVLLILCLAFSFPSRLANAAQESPDQPQVTINKVYITNVNEVAFDVTWSTDTLTDGSVNWGLTNTLGTVANDPISNTSTHYVKIEGLNPSTLYYFQVSSGGTTDPTIYTVTTGPILDPPTAGRTIEGILYEQDGSTLVPNAIVYIQVQDNGNTGNGSSQWGSARTNANGYWSYSLNNLRSEDLTEYFFMNNGTDLLRLVWQGGVKGAKGENAAPLTYTLPTTYPATFDMNLDGNPTAVRLTNLSVRPSSSLLAWIESLFARLGK